MKKILFIMIGVLCFSFCACSNSDESKETEIMQVATKPDLSQIRSICKLATLECNYHNVAKSTKEAGSGLTHWFEKDRVFWTEYTGTVKIGIDMSKGSMNVDGNNITIFIPSAEILSIDIDPESTKDPITNDDGWLNSNKITADDTTKAINQGQEDIQNQINSNSSLLANAQDRAEKLIENYINKIGESSGTTFNITFQPANS